MAHYSQGIDLSGLDKVFRICGWEAGVDQLRKRVADYYTDKDPQVVQFLKEMKSYDQPKLKKAPASKNNMPREVDEDFIDRVKAIITKAAEKNNKTIKTNARGHAREYIYYVDSELFCKTMDAFAREHSDMLMQFLEGSVQCVQVTKVCQFIGHILRMHIINDQNLQMADILFAFKKYYTLSTVKVKLSKQTQGTYEDKLLFESFRSVSKRYKTQNNPE
ncbi:hypothetical protein [Xylanibacter ruminicola]|uniref:Uncharacterized protein n=1 Tax=Xylanibacter ruminicola TaxID=839 RepID=A0A1M6VUM2_XYLRU|nr:hypothetical protein [Xylanibacter ruminicola]SHK85150.1 hypothetical protein SAMN05216463_11426 [Xylanibacter ruminicola]